MFSPRRTSWMLALCMMFPGVLLGQESTPRNTTPRQTAPPAARPRYLVPGNGYFTYKVPGRGSVTYYNAGPSYYTYAPGYGYYAGTWSAAYPPSTYGPVLSQPTVPQYRTYWRNGFAPDWNPRYRPYGDTSDDNGYYGYGIGP